MPDRQFDARAEIEILRTALAASHQQTAHMHQVFGGWEECAPCEKANDECDGDLACDKHSAWQKQVEAGHRSRAEVAVDRLRAELLEATTKLEIAERRNTDLADQLDERTRQLSGLLSVLDFDEKAVPA
ncbi:hypothetical protein [Streptomyces sp. NPDC096339]|uniref:hypothetical protein n=1 Tax=Streptomyces sp. NPDC096339 TaxID=3366086 RepID=UPI003806D155